MVDSNGAKHLRLDFLNHRIHTVIAYFLYKAGAVSDSAVCKGGAIGGKLNGCKSVVRLTDGRLQRVSGVPYASYGIAVFLTCQNSRSLIKLDACFNAQSEFFAELVELFNTYSSTGFVEEIVTGHLNGGRNIDVAIVVQTGGLIVAVIGVSLRAENCFVGGNGTGLKADGRCGGFKCGSWCINSAEGAVKQGIALVRQEGIIIVIICVNGIGWICCGGKGLAGVDL